MVNFNYFKLKKLVSKPFTESQEVSKGIILEYDADDQL